MGEMTKNQKKEALRAWRQKEKKSYCLEKEEVEELFDSNSSLGSPSR